MSRLTLPARTRALFLVLLSLLVTVPALGLVMTAGGGGGGARHTHEARQPHVPVLAGRADRHR